MCGGAGVLVVDASPSSGPQSTEDEADSPKSNPLTHLIGLVTLAQWAGLSKKAIKLANTLGESAAYDTYAGP